METFLKGLSKLYLFLAAGFIILGLTSFPARAEALSSLGSPPEEVQEDGQFNEANPEISLAAKRRTDEKKEDSSEGEVSEPSFIDKLAGFSKDHRFLLLITEGTLLILIIVIVVILLTGNKGPAAGTPPGMPDNTGYSEGDFEGDNYSGNAEGDFQGTNYTDYSEGDYGRTENSWEGQEPTIMGYEIERSVPTLILSNRFDRAMTYERPLSRQVIIGRSPQCDIVISEDKSVSSRHCAITSQNGHFYITDLGSTNRTKVNGISVLGTKELFGGETISLGRVELIVSFI